MEVFLEGHGTWQQGDGVFQVRDNLTFYFFCQHGERVRGQIRPTDPVQEVFPPGGLCPNYRLWPFYSPASLSCDNARRYLLGDPVSGTRDTIIIGIHGWGPELAYIAHGLSRRYEGQDVKVYWLACREVSASGAFFTDRADGISIQLLIEAVRREVEMPRFSSGAAVEMSFITTSARLRIRAYESWARRRVEFGVIPSVVPAVRGEARGGGDEMGAKMAASKMPEVCGRPAFLDRVADGMAHYMCASGHFTTKSVGSGKPPARIDCPAG